LREGCDVAIIAYGVMVARALDAAKALASDGVQARVVNMASLAPLDEAAIRAAADLGAIVTVEEHSIRGGLGGALAEVVAGYRPCPVRRLGFPGFLPTGSAEFLFEKFALTARGIATAAREAIAARRAP
ncbi:MAG: transketolase family protein, partial [Hyphomicrobiales bacterium]|nr:transketolase family protein [Hyphomicrobiales bacterium]